MTQTIAQLITTYQITVVDGNLKCKGTGRDGKISAEDIAAIKANKTEIIATLAARDAEITRSVMAETNTCSVCGKKHTETVKVGMRYYCTTCHTMLNQMDMDTETINDNSPVYKN
ncbi:MAG: hypothetical protein VB076_05025 [Synergistaceae bacterium]|nr:hypothetical protein [Synergistaceae bacterium]